MNIGQDTTLGNGDVSEKLVQFLIVACQEMSENIQKIILLIRISSELN